MYMNPTVTLPSYGSPVRPLNSWNLPEQRRPSRSLSSMVMLIATSGWLLCQSISARSTSSGVAPSKTGVDTKVRPSGSPSSPASGFQP